MSLEAPLGAKWDCSKWFFNSFSGFGWLRHFSLVVEAGGEGCPSKLLLKRSGTGTQQCIMFI
jgi:hypothetical protein